MLLLQLLQQALQAAPSQKASKVLSPAAATEQHSTEEQAWSVDLANAICQQVGHTLLRFVSRVLLCALRHCLHFLRHASHVH